ncbi:MAG: chemotaxis protein CheA [Thalassolituus sp.]|nr:MAG: chemotaxis protein CheA [Thalassolituus sp.]
MSPLLEQFVSETRDLLQSISEQLLEVEKAEDKQATLNELFRIVHTLKGNTGLFEFPDLTRVLHAGEDVMSEAREQTDLWDQTLTDLLFDAMDFVSNFCDSLEENDGEPVSDSALASQLEKSLRAYLEASSGEADADRKATSDTAEKTTKTTKKTAGKKKSTKKASGSKRRPPRAKGLPAENQQLAELSYDQLNHAWQNSEAGGSLWLVNYRPITECFFQGDDPLHSARMAPGVVWGTVISESRDADINDLDPYQCVSTFHLLSNASEEEIREHFRYVDDQTDIEELSVEQLLLLQGEEQKDALPEETVDALCEAIEGADLNAARQIAETSLELLNSELKAASALRWIIDIADGETATSTEKRDAQIIIAQRLRHDQHLSGYRFTVVENMSDEDDQSDEDSSDVSDSDTQNDVQSDDGALANLSHDFDAELDSLNEEDREAFEHIIRTQGRILEFDPADEWSRGRIKAACNVLHNAVTCLELKTMAEPLDTAIASATEGDLTALSDWINEVIPGACEGPGASVSGSDTSENDTENNPSDNTLVDNTDIDDTEADESSTDEQSSDKQSTVEEATESAGATGDTASHEPKIEQEPEKKTEPDAPVKAAAKVESKPKQEAKPASIKPEPAVTTSKSVKVDQEKIDRLMNLIGEMTVAKNALPFLAKRAEEQHGLRDLAREIKEQYAVVNRIAEEMQDSIMQIRMMPFSFISMRFPRLVRDISRRLEKDVQLIIEGEDTEADKNIIESLAEPLIHIVRNSLDHGIESPEVRQAQGKSTTGTLTIRASQEADRVMIEIHDDGKGINPDVIREKAFEKGLIDDATRQRITDKEAVNLVLMPGFSTAEEVSDLSGRGVGMDAVRSAVDKVNGTMALESEVGKGTRIRISLPMSIAVTRVMIVESDEQLMGIPMDQVLETVRVPRSEIHTVKHVQTTVLRDRIVPLKSLNDLLALPAEQIINEEEEHAVLVARVGNDVIGLVVDDFRGSVDIIQKPMAGVLSGMQAYSGAALIGDGSVLMVLNLKEIL